METLRFYPKYFKDFSCLAGDCPENCCSEWTINLDPDTVEFYRSVPGDFGERLINSMEEIASVEGRAGEKEFIFKNDGIRCPFLSREDGLCEIRKRLGVEHTSKTCREHPEINDDYGVFKVTSLSLSCPAVAKLVSDTPVSGTYPSLPEDTGDKILDLLSKKRNELFSNFDEDKDFFDHAFFLKDSAAGLQKELNRRSEKYHTDIPAGRKNFFNLGEAKDALTFYQSLEILTSRWKMLLARAANKKSSLFPTEENADEEKEDKGFIGFLKNNRVLISRIYAYYLFRYFIKAHSDCNLISWAGFIYYSCLVTGYVSYRTKYPLIKTASLYSREIEHNAKNAAAVLDRICETGVKVKGNSILS